MLCLSVRTGCAHLVEEDLVRILHSLSCSMYRILTKDLPSKAGGKNNNECYLLLSDKEWPLCRGEAVL